MGHRQWGILVRSKKDARDVLSAVAKHNAIATHPYEENDIAAYDAGEELCVSCAILYAGDVFVLLTNGGGGTCTSKFLFKNLEWTRIVWTFDHPDDWFENFEFVWKNERGGWEVPMYMAEDLPLPEDFPRPVGVGFMGRYDCPALRGVEIYPDAMNWIPLVKGGMREASHADVESLVASAKRGDRAAIDELVDRSGIRAACDDIDDFYEFLENGNEDAIAVVETLSLRSVDCLREATLKGDWTALEALFHLSDWNAKRKYEEGEALRKRAKNGDAAAVDVLVELAKRREVHCPTANPIDFQRRFDALAALFRPVVSVIPAPGFAAVTGTGDDVDSLVASVKRGCTAALDRLVDRSGIVSTGAIGDDFFELLEEGDEDAFFVVETLGRRSVDCLRKAALEGDRTAFSALEHRGRWESYLTTGSETRWKAERGDEAALDLLVERAKRHETPGRISPPVDFERFSEAAEAVFDFWDALVPTADGCLVKAFEASVDVLVASAKEGNRTALDELVDRSGIRATCDDIDDFYELLEDGDEDAFSSIETMSRRSVDALLEAARAGDGSAFEALEHIGRWNAEGACVEGRDVRRRAEEGDAAAMKILFDRAKKREVILRFA